METWIDEKHKLEWQVEHPLDPMNWYHAIAYANTLGDGWRAPTIEELETLVDRNRFYPAMRAEIPFNHPSIYSSIYWSSSPFASSSYNAWCVDFYDGSVNHYSTFYKCYVRCVRDAA